MRSRLNFSLSILIILFTGCGGGGGGGSSSSDNTFTTGRNTPARIAIDDYLNKVAIPTLANIDNSALTLRTRISTLLANPSEANLASTRAAWVAARISWERNQSSNFGPLITDGFNAKLDSWPIDTAQLQTLLASQADLTEGAVESFSGTLKGYHVVEYILWGENGIKKATEITQREASLLTSVVSVLRKDTSSLLGAWNRDANPYAMEVALAGQGSEVYPTEDSMLEAEVRGMISVLEDLSENKLAEDNFNDVESHYSGNTLNEFVDDVVGARDSYTISISQLVDDREVDLNVRGDFELAINALQLIPQPFDAAIANPANDTRINNARDRIRNLTNELRTGVLPLFVEQIQPIVPDPVVPVEETTQTTP